MKMRREKKHQWTPLAGVTFGDCQKNIKKWANDDIQWYAMVREPDNEHDPNAIRVSLFDEFDLGYLPARLAKKYAPMMDSGRNFLAQFVRKNESPKHDVVGCVVQIIEQVEDDDETSKENR